MSHLVGAKKLAPSPQNIHQHSMAGDSMPYAAVITDQNELFRTGIAHVLQELDIPVVASTPRAGEALRIARDGAAGFLIVGRCADLKPQQSLKEAKKLKTPLYVVILLEKADEKDVARLLSAGVDGLLLRTTKGADLKAALMRIEKGERVIAPAFAVGTLGNVGPVTDESGIAAAKASGLSPKELEVLAVLAEGATYKEIADALIVTQATIKTHLVHIYAKLQVKNRDQAVAKALSLGLLG